MNALIDQLLGAGWRQTDRLLVLTTPAGPDVLLAESARIDEALGPDVGHAGYRIELTALATDSGLGLAELLGQPARLDLQTAASRLVRRPFHGHITTIAHEGANGGFARYRLTIEPWLAFLDLNRDSYLFQDKTVIEIIDDVLGDWSGQGKLAPAWRWDLADASIYPKRGLTTQYQESDLAFIKRLLAEEGLFLWFEHSAASDATLGAHTLVIADHNGAFAANAQPRVRFTQSGATLSEDSLDRWTGRRRIDTAETCSASWDYRSLSSRPQTAASRIDQGAAPPAVAWHDPGQYAWSSAAQGDRMIGNQRQALDARLKQFHGAGTVRSAAPGTTFDLADHAEHDRDALTAPEAARFLITAVRHYARNNLGARIPGSDNDPAAQALSTLDRSPAPPSQSAETSQSNSSARFYRNELTAIRASIPWRALMADEHGRHIHPRPTVCGHLTALVVGSGQPTHTERDLRVRVQFPWQRGSQSASRQPHPTDDDNAPASERLGIWLHVMTPVAGANWGGHLIPRPGQEVLVAFQNGNIDRPVIIGATYNGQGQSDAAGNRIAGAPQKASANAPAYFAGDQDSQHTHQAALSGLKSQQLATSLSGQGGYNQLVFDDTPGQGRIELASSEHRSQLQLGHLKQQTDNARQADRGHGAELATQASLALRAGNGLLISADARPNASGGHLDSREAIRQTEDARELAQSLAELAKKQNAALKNEATTLPAIASLQHAGEVLAATATQGAAQSPTEEGIKRTLGGSGTVPAWREARLQFSAPAGIAQLTPVAHVLVAGRHLAMANQDTNLVAQGNHSLASKDGLVIFTHGQAKDRQKPNQETGIHLHAASGTVSLQSQSGKTTAAADKKVTIASTDGSLTASAKGHLLATAQGAYLKIEGGKIELHAPGAVAFKASQKNLTGPASASAEGLTVPAAKDLYDEQFVIRDEQTQQAIAGAPYRIEDATGKVLFQGIADEKGQTARLTFGKAEKLKLIWGR